MKYVIIYFCYSPFLVINTVGKAKDYDYIIPNKSWSSIWGLLVVFFITAGANEFRISAYVVPSPNFKLLKNVPYLFVYFIW